MKQENFSEKIELLFNYELTEKEALDFMSEIAEDETLCKEFDIEMQLRFGSGIDTVMHPNVQVVDTDDTLESAVSHLAAVRSLLEYGQNKKGKNSGKLVRLFTRPSAIAAAILILIGIGIAIRLLLPEPTGHNLVGANNQLPDSFSIAKNIQKSLNKPIGPVQQSINIDSLLRTYYQQLIHQRYAPGVEDPVAVSKYLYAYQQRNLRALTRFDNDFTTKGMNVDSQRMSKYVNFYKAIAHLELGEANPALELLLPLLKQVRDKEELYDPILWYTGLCYLQKKDKKEYTLYLKKYINLPYKTTYKQKAKEILKGLTE